MPPLKIIRLVIGGDVSHLEGAWFEPISKTSQPAFNRPMPIPSKRKRKYLAEMRRTMAPIPTPPWHVVATRYGRSGRSIVYCTSSPDAIARHVLAARQRASNNTNESLNESYRSEGLITVDLISVKNWFGRPGIRGALDAFKFLWFLHLRDV